MSHARTSLRLLLLIAALGALAVWTRTTHIASAGLSSDEAFSWRLTRYPALELVRRTAGDVHPPFGYLALKAWTAPFGTSPTGLRSFSILLGLLTILALGRLVYEHEADQAERGRRAPALAASLAAFFVVIGEAQVSASRNARMYQLGLLLSACAGLLLLRALRAEKRRALAWLAYGVCAALLVYTHYYGAFTLVAQAVWVLGRVGVRWRAGLREAARRDLAGLAFGTAISLALFALWLPALRRQVTEVWRDYWIPPLSAERVARGLLEWGVGTPDPAWGLGLLVAGVTAFIAWRGRPGAFFALQALLPWVCGVLLSSVSSRSVLLTRYMVFAQLSLLALWAVSLARMPRRWERNLALAALAAVSASSLLVELRAYAASEAIEPKAIRFLQRQGRPGDVVLVDAPLRVNRLGYYAEQAGLRGIPIRCVLDRASVGSGHVPHLSALTEDDVVWRDALPSLAASRVWWGGPDAETWPDPPPAWQSQVTRHFHSDVTRDFALTLYLRSEGADNAPSSTETIGSVPSRTSRR